MRKALIMVLTICMLTSLCLVACNRIPQAGFPVESSSTVENESSSTLPNDSSSSSPEDSSGTVTPPVDPDKEIRVLFLGNSLMFFNDMPSLFRDLAKNAGKKVYVDSVTRGSATISDFAHSYTDVGAKTYPKLLGERWDYVIIEPSRRITPYENTVFQAELSAAKTIQTMARNAGAEVLLYCVWGNNDGTLTQYDATNPTAMIKGQVHYDYTRKMHVEFLKEVNERISEALGGVGVIDAGYAFENSIATYPAINLYDSDKRHPSLEGSYLAAACVYATIYNQSPENIGFTGGTTLYFEMQRMAKVTVIDKVIPDLEEKPEVIEQVDDPNVYDILFVGSDLINNYDLVTPLTSMVSSSESLGLHVTYVTSGTGVFNLLAKEHTDFGMRDALMRRKYDAVILQISRRCTPSSTDIEQSELAALKAIYPLICENTDNLFLYTFNGSANPTRFTTQGGADSYTKTDLKENATVAEMNTYYSNLANAWAEEVGCGVILQGVAWTEFNPVTDAAKGYLRACAIYNSIFEKEVPNGVNTNGVDSIVAANIQATVEKHCLGKEPVIPEPPVTQLPDPETYDILVIGSSYMTTYGESGVLASMISEGQGKELYIQYITDSVGVINKIYKEDASDAFYSKTVDALGERKWDAVIIQISRRCTPGSSVEVAELEALKNVVATVHENTNSVYLFTLGGSENPAIFEADGSIEYAKTSYKVMATAEQMSEYFTALAKKWADETSIKTILQGKAAHSVELANNDEKGYLRACAIYNSIFESLVPASVNGSLSQERALELRKVAAGVCLENYTADLTALNLVIERANALVETAYTPNSWAGLQTVLNGAKAVTSKTYQEEVNAVKIALEKAIEDLCDRADFTALNSAISDAESKVAASYTDSSYAKLLVALENAKAIDFNASQEVVNQAVTALNDAISGLIVKADLSSLNEAIALAEGKNASEYTVVSWAQVESALAVAREITENSSVEEVANATLNLNNAIAALTLKANLSALTAILQEVELLNADDYTEDSWGALQTAVDATVGLTQESSQADVDTAVDNVRTAINGLQNKVVEPVLPDPETYDILIVGSNLIHDYSTYTDGSLASMIELGQGKQLHVEYVVDGVGIFNRLIAREDETNNEDVYTLLRTALSSRKWDAIILQLSRRCTPGSAVVDSEFNALQTVYPLLSANCDNIYLFTLNGSSNPAIFANEGVSYVKTGETYTATAAEMAEFYKTTVETWASALGCQTILYGSAFVEMSPSTDKAKGFMRALSMYYAIFDEEMPAGANTQGTSSSGIKNIKAACAKYCLTNA